MACAVASVAVLIATLSCFSFIPAQWLLRSEALSAMFQYGPRELVLFLAVLLPVATPVNINTASPQVLAAVVPGLGVAATQQWTSIRDTQAWNSLEEAQKKLGASAAGLNPKLHSINSGFFEVIGQLRLDSVALIEKSLVRRTGMDSHTVWQERRASRSEPGCMVTVAAPC